MDTDLLRQRLIDLRAEINLSQSELARQIGMDNTAISKIESRTRKVSAEELNLFSEFYDVSTDYLLGRSNKRHYYELTAKDQKAIDEELEEIVEGLSDKSGVSFLKNNTELSERDRELLIVSLRQSIALTHEMAKKKFTPKKFRGSESEN